MSPFCPMTERSSQHGLSGPGSGPSGSRSTGSAAVPPRANVHTSAQRNCHSHSGSHAGDAAGKHITTLFPFSTGRFCFSHGPVLPLTPPSSMQSYLPTPELFAGLTNVQDSSPSVHLSYACRSAPVRIMADYSIDFWILAENTGWCQEALSLIEKCKR